MWEESTHVVGWIADATDLVAAIMIVSDILYSCVHKDLESLAELGALVVIRTVISFFLGKELESVHGEEATS